MPDAKPAETRCLYCGRPYAVGMEQCPQCGAPAHPNPHKRLRQFRWFVALLALLCLVLILWLPR